jgi:hypothetical protein
MKIYFGFTVAGDRSSVVTAGRIVDLLADTFRRNRGLDQAQPVPNETFMTERSYLTSSEAPSNSVWIAPSRYAFPQRGVWTILQV